MRRTSYLHVSHIPVLALERKRSAINENVAEGVKRLVTSFQKKREESCIEMREFVNRDVSFRGSGARAVREFTCKALCP